MTPLRRIKLTKLNRHLVCPLCNGYFVEATTITECLHTFCKTCIVRYLNASSFCPVCDVQVHKTKPTSGLREDKTLQDVVFKLVPDLFCNEMNRRAQFYKEHPEAGGDKTEQSLKERRHFFHVDDQISLSLEFLPPAHAHAHALGLRPLRAPFHPHASTSFKDKEENNNSKESCEEGSEGKKVGGSAANEQNASAKNEEGKVEIPIRRYLKCPAAVQIRLLEKFIRLKYGLSTHHRVDIVHGGDCLSPELTLLDVVYMYKWTEDNPLNLQYTVIAPPLPLRKRPRSQSSKPRTYFPETSPKKNKICIGSSKISPQKFKIDQTGSDKKLLISTHIDESKTKILALTTITSLKAEENKDITSMECTNSLNSSRDEADDAMVIDEGISDNSNIMDLDTNDSSKAGEIDTQKPVKKDLTDEIQKFYSQSNFSVSSVSNKVSSPITKVNTPIEQKSYIESLKALVNSSSYSEFPAKPTQLKSNSPYATSNNKNLNSESNSSQTLKLQNLPDVLNVEIPMESCVSLANDTKNLNTITACDTPVTSCLSLIDNKPGILTTSYNNPEILSTICMSEGIGLTSTVPAAATMNMPIASKTSVSSTTSSSVVHTSVSNTHMACRSTSLCTSVNVSKSESLRNQSNSEIVNKRFLSDGDSSKDKITNGKNDIAASIQQTTPENASLGLSSKSATISKSSSISVSKFNQMIHSSTKSAVVGSSIATPASTSLTSAIKTPLASSTPSSSMQPFPVSAISDNSVSQKSQPPVPRNLISNSYRNSVPITNGLKINGIMPAPRPILDPTKPRLGRPPNSARIAAAAAGRVGPQPILPRGASPREIYSHKAVGHVKGEGRGRPKSQNVTGSGRVSMNRLGTQQSSMSIGKNMSLSQPNSHSHIPQCSTDSSSVVGRESQANVVNTLTSNVNEAVSHNFNKKLLPKINNNIAGDSKGIASSTNSMNNVNNIINKINKKLAPEQNNSSPMNNLQNSLLISSPKGSTSQTKSSSVSNVSSVKTIKSPNRTKSNSSNSSSILSIAQNLANKQLQQRSHVDSILSTGSTTTSQSAISSATVAAAAAAAAAASLGPQFNAALPPALCAYMAANYNTMQNLLLSQAAVRTLSQASSLQDQSIKLDSCPMDLSPSNKTSQVSPINSSQISKVKGSSNSSKKSSQHTKPIPLPSPKSNIYTSPTVISSVPSKSPSVDSTSVLQTSTISPPTSEVTITKLPNTSAESSSTSSSTISSTKPSHTNTVSITKRPSVTSAASSSSSSNGISTSKFGITRSPSNASVRQIPNPSLLSHQSDVRNNSSSKGNKLANQGIPSAVTNNNSSNKNNNNSNKLMKVDS